MSFLFMFSGFLFFSLFFARIRLRGTPEKTKIAWPKRRHPKTYQWERNPHEDRQPKNPTAAQSAGDDSQRAACLTMPDPPRSVTARLVYNATRGAQKSMRPKANTGRGVTKGKCRLTHLARKGRLPQSRRPAESRREAGIPKRDRQQ